MAKSGFVSIVGKPNAGKSTLVNWLVGERLKMVSHKANATRRRSNAIIMHGDHQIIVIDTPGLHHKEKLLNKFMLKEALKSIEEADVVLFLADVRDSTQAYKEFLTLLPNQIPHLLLVTKIDKVNEDRILATLQKYAPFADRYAAIIPVSAKNNINRGKILDNIVSLLPEGPYYYDPELLTTEWSREIYRELIRESLFENLSDEIPYESDVIIEKIDESENVDHIKAAIVVARRSQKGVVIGEGGATIKRIGIAARRKIEAFSHKRIYLELFVKHEQNWMNNQEFLREIGYEVE
ncbi:MAG: GTPase Era [Campylobacterales bacterium]